MLALSHLASLSLATEQCHASKLVYQTATCCGASDLVSNVCAMKKVGLANNPGGMMDMMSKEILALTYGHGPTSKAATLYPYGAEAVDTDKLKEFYLAPSAEIETDNFFSKGVLFDDSIEDAKKLLKPKQILVSVPNIGLVYSVPFDVSLPSNETFAPATDIAKPFDDRFGGSTLFYACEDETAIFAGARTSSDPIVNTYSKTSVLGSLHLDAGKKIKGDDITLSDLDDGVVEYVLVMLDSAWCPSCAAALGLPHSSAAGPAVARDIAAAMDGDKSVKKITFFVDESYGSKLAEMNCSIDLRINFAAQTSSCQDDFKVFLSAMAGIPEGPELDYMIGMFFPNLQSSVPQPSPDSPIGSPSPYPEGVFIEMYGLDPTFTAAVDNILNVKALKDLNKPYTGVDFFNHLSPGVYVDVGLYGSTDFPEMQQTGFFILDAKTGEVVVPRIGGSMMSKRAPQNRAILEYIEHKTGWDIHSKLLAVETTGYLAVEGLFNVSGRYDTWGLPSMMGSYDNFTYSGDYEIVIPAYKKW